MEVLDTFERLARIDPRLPGIAHAAVSGLWLFEGPTRGISRLPRLVIVYTIDEAEGFVDLWNLYRL